MTAMGMTERPDQATIEDVPVLIAGAGLAGLSTAMFLGRHGVPSLVVERHPGTAQQPKARGQMPATMEALQAAGVADRFRAAAPPGRPETAIVVARSVAGPVLHSFTQAEPDFAAFSPEASGLVSQERAEPILAGRAIEFGAAVSFLTSLESFRADDSGVLALLRDVRTGQDRAVRAQYLVAADGHKGTIRDALGIATHGRGNVDSGQAAFLLFEADLQAAWGDSAVHIYYLQNRDLPGGSATLVSTDVPGRHVCAIPVAAGQDPAGLGEQRCVEIIRTAVGRDDLAVKLAEVSSSSGSGGTRVADAFGTDRVFLAGDSAHLMPPTGGQGGNAAVMDGFHLAWKLAAVVRGHAGPGLLASHDAERRPFADLLAEQQYAYMVQRYGQPADDTVAEIMDPATALFGYCCPAGAFVPEPGPASGPASGPGAGPRDALFEDPAAPTGRPGARAAHVPLLRDGAPISTRDLFGRGFVVLTGADGGAWVTAAGEVARRLRIGIDAWPIAGVASRPGVASRLSDPEGRWPAAYGVTLAGAVLVRPDGIVGWRARDAAPSGQAAAALSQAFDTILARVQRLSP
jgi:2-polyprenyl-6-methoxyphenol hydroxylase-like FAD-dependent oxidoreductase